MTWMTVVAWVAGGMLGIAAVLAVVRAALGPSMPNRAVAIDVLVAVLVGGLGVEAAYNRHTDTLPILVVLSLVGMVGSVSIARFATSDEPDESDPERIDGTEGSR
ncbi:MULTISPECIES: monovalent cation/H+ antiporter complex subunit F [Mumia]|uniref:monovalent cation/H+ antiporter complex subunit F n=1 Tax=Mumia TaxID=1546255 RepID=UPI001AB05B15|nr:MULTISPECIES: monovalent cation/H+ antiporter complex subunit F [unclassified Mumia]